MTDPVWFCVTDWFPIYLVDKGIELKTGLIAIWIPFLAADLGNFFGGGISGYLIKRGWSLGAARKAVVIFGGLGGSSERNGCVIAAQSPRTSVVGTSRSITGNTGTPLTRSSTNS
mgnify:CR=1 FL=1